MASYFFLYFFKSTLTLQKSLCIYTPEIEVKVERQVGLKMIRTRQGRKFYVNELDECVKAECTGCHRIKPVSEFNKSSSSKYGIKFKCKSCLKKEHNNRVERHEPVIYKITFEDCVYIGQTKSMKQRQQGHISKARNGQHCKVLNSLYKKDSEAFIKAVESMEVIHKFNARVHSSTVERVEYDIQIDHMLQGVNVVGGYDEDVKFKQYLVDRLGGVSAILKVFKGER